MDTETHEWTDKVRKYRATPGAAFFEELDGSSPPSVLLNPEPLRKELLQLAEGKRAAEAENARLAAVWEQEILARQQLAREVERLAKDNAELKAHAARQTGEVKAAMDFGLKCGKADESARIKREMEAVRDQWKGCPDWCAEMTAAIDRIFPGEG